MKGTTDLITTIFGVMVFMFGVTFNLVSFISEMTVVTGGLVQSNYEKLALIDTSHSFERCLSRKEASDIKKNLEECRKDLGVDYAELIDVHGESPEGILYKSGTGRLGQGYHSVYTTVSSEGERHQARISVWKKV